MRHATTLTIVVLIATAMAAQGAVPETMSYQGILRTAVGDPVPDGPYDLTFRLYDADVAGTLLWFETQTVDVTEGVFSAILGSTTPLSLAFDETYWLGISVGADPELTPRTELTSAPYALRAAVADVGSDSDWAFSGGDIYRLSGRVGIGIPNPAYKLDVRDDVDGVTGIRIQNTDPGSASREELRFDNEDGSLAGIYMYDNDHIYSSAMIISNSRPGGNIRLATAGTERVRISNSGNVGIGVPDPSEKLDVGGTARVDGFEMDTGAAAGHVLTSNASGTGTWQAPAAVPDDDWVVDGDDVYRLVGNVGMGTDAPNYALDIRRDVDATVGVEIDNQDTGDGSSESIRLTSETGSCFITAYDDGSTFYPNGLSITNGRSGGGIQFRTGGSKQLEVDWLGRVGINVASPTERLEVGGTAKVEGFTLTESPVAGHVLTSDASGNGTWQAPAGGLTLPYAGTAASEPDAVFTITNSDVGPAIEGLNTHLYGDTRGYLADIYYGVLGEDLDSGNFAYLADGNYGVYAKSFTDQAIHGRHEPSGNYAALAGPDYGARLNGDVIVLNGGVGIGADPPTQELHVVGEALITSGTNTDRALDVKKTIPGSVAQTANIERTFDASSGNDLLQLWMPTGSSESSQFIECERGGLFEFVVDGDGHVQTLGGATIIGLLEAENETGNRTAEFVSQYASGTTHVVHAEYTGGGYDATAVYGKSRPADEFGYGGYFEGGYMGVQSTVASSGSYYYYGVNSVVTGGTGYNYGVRGYTTGSGNNYAIYGYASGGGANYAGYFNGNAHVSGTMSKGGGSFKIDHPLDPQNKYLYHSFVESPDMMNIYNGNAMLDATGEAWIELPEWFGALNRDFRYQLTAIGAPGPNLYVAEEIVGNRFKVAGGDPGMKVSWQVTGVRQDAFAEENRIPVEEDKPANERGKYLHPTAFGLPETMSVDYVEGEPRPVETAPYGAERKGERVRSDDGS